MTTSGTVSTLIASANVAGTERRASRGADGRSVFDKLTVGQHLRMQVLRQLEQQRYEVTFGGRRHVVESRVPLEAGTQIEAQVEAKGEQLELRYLETTGRAEAAGASVAAGVTPTDDAQATPDVAVAPWIEALARQYHVTLDARAREAIARTSAKVGDPQLLARGALFLQKLARDVDARDLEALYRALSLPERGTATPAQARVSLEDVTQHDDVASTIADALDQAAQNAAGAPLQDTAADSDAGGEGEQDAQRALRLLNLQDDGSVAWRYGTLPLLVGGRLIELDLVMFREREAHARRGALRRLVMTLDTTHFGRVHVEARAVDSRLTVTMSAPSRDAVEVLSAYGQDVRAAIERLGWAVDDIRYELEAPHAGAAQSVVQHVLSAGTVDQEL